MAASKSAGGASKGAGRKTAAMMAPEEGHAMLRGERLVSAKESMSSQMMSPDQMVAIMKQQPTET